jgi:hypothetical protein
MRLTFTSFLLLISLFCTAQLQRGDLVLTLTDIPIEPEIGDNPWRANLGYIAYGNELTEFVLQGTYGYALTDRLLFGASMGIGSDLSSNILAIHPYARYYLINRATLGLFAQAQTDWSASWGDVEGLTILQTTVGLQFSLADNVRFGPAVKYTIREGRNSLQAAAQLELVLDRHASSGERAVAGFGAGSIMLGGQIAELFTNNVYFGGQLQLNGSYFLSDRFAAGLGVGLGGGRVSEGEATFPGYSYRSSNYSLVVAPRYYLTRDRHLVWFTEATLGYRYRSVDQRGGPGFDAAFSDSGLFGSLGVGGQLFVWDNIALEAVPQLQQSWINDAPETRFAISIGAHFFLR